MVGLIKKILKEYDFDEEDFYTKDILSEVQYKNLFKIFDKNPDNIFTLLKDLSFQHQPVEELESNLIYKYLTEYKDRTNHYVNVTFNANEIASNFFCSDRNYDIQDMVEGYLRSDYDYGHQECYNYDSYYFDRIDQQNLDFMKEYFIHHSFGDEPTEDEFKEFVEEEFGDDIGCAASDAQFSADIDLLHSEFNDKIEEHLSLLDGKLQPPVDNEGNRGFGLEYVGHVEIGDLANSNRFKEIIYDHLQTGYPDNFSEILDTILEYEINEWDKQYNYFIPEECITINTDKHFRYGGAGDIDWEYFNEILSDRLRYH